jgi:CHAT domain-containing protein
MSTDTIDFYLHMAAEAVERSRMKIIAPEKQRTISEAGAPIYTALLHRALARGEPRIVFNTVERSRSRAILSQFVTAPLWHAYPPMPQQLDHAANLRCQEARCFQEIGPSDASWQDADMQLIQRWKFRLKVRRDFLYQLEESMLSRACEVETVLRPVTCEELQAHLPAHTAVVLYICEGPPEGTPYALVVTAAEIAMIPLPTTIHTVHTAIVEYQHHLATIASSPRGEMSWRSDLLPDQILYSALIAPLHVYLRGSKHIYLVPDGILWQFPLHACGGTHALCVEYLVGYVFSGSVLSRLLARKHPDVPPKGFLGIAEADGTLPGAEEEVAFAAQAFADSTTLIGPTVTLHDSLATIGQAAIIHIACHGAYCEDFPEFSYLQLYTDKHREERLEVCTITHTPIAADLVVLNACHSGRGTVHLGNDFIGFPSAFLAAGAATVIGTLWNIDNEAAIAFMTHFYQALARTPKACAFQAAQRFLAETPAYRHPFFWAAFQWFGLLA